ncbi:hypothetical protein [Streptomyces chartreusis]|uniref:hypothetical protein n=1 Tax=Streptomyces chartreusis TaxID=1969 RepID=UPI00362B62DC
MRAVPRAPELGGCEANPRMRWELRLWVGGRWADLQGRGELRDQPPPARTRR